MKRVRIINGYRAIYCPESSSAMTNANHKGYVYEHRFILEKKIGRPLQKGEVVHHKNLGRLDNRIENLQLMSEKEHRRLHFRIDVERGNKNWKTCRYCGTIIAPTLSFKVCRDCYNKRKQERRKRIPLREVLLREQETMSYEAIGRKYGVSSSAVRKWCKGY